MYVDIVTSNVFNLNKHFFVFVFFFFSSHVQPISSAQRQQQLLIFVVNTTGNQMSRFWARECRVRTQCQHTVYTIYLVSIYSGAIIEVVIYCCLHKQPSYTVGFLTSRRDLFHHVSELHGWVLNHTKRFITSCGRTTRSGSLPHEEIYYIMCQSQNAKMWTKMLRQACEIDIWQKETCIMPEANDCFAPKGNYCLPPARETTPLW